MANKGIHRFVLLLSVLVAIFGTPTGQAAETIDDVVQSARSPAEKAEACSYAFSELGSSIRAAHADPDSMPIDLVHEDFQIAEDFDVSALVFDNIAREVDRPPARNDAIERIQQSMSNTASQDDGRHTLMVAGDKRAIQLCTPILQELERRGAVTRAQEEIFRKIVRDGQR